MYNLENIYKRRFGSDIEFRTKMYKVLCNSFFCKYVNEDDTVLDIAAGNCEFINNIKAKNKIALDLNPAVKKFAADGVKVVISSSTNLKGITNQSVDTVFISNFFEHLSKEDIVKTIKEIHRVLKEDGKLLIVQPNIRYCYKDYWMFFDHLTPLDDRSLTEVLELNGFKIKKCMPKFLPYTTKGRLPKSILLLKIYLKLPFLFKIFGKQAFIFARKI